MVPTCWSLDRMSGADQPSSINKSLIIRILLVFCLIPVLIFVFFTFSPWRTGARSEGYMMFFVLTPLIHLINYINLWFAIQESDQRFIYLFIYLLRRSFLANYSSVPPAGSQRFWFVSFIPVYINLPFFKIYLCIHSHPCCWLSPNHYLTNTIRKVSFINALHIKCIIF